MVPCAKSGGRLAALLAAAAAMCARAPAFTLAPSGPLPITQLPAASAATQSSLCRAGREAPSVAAATGWEGVAAAAAVAALAAVAAGGSGRAAARRQRQQAVVSVGGGSTFAGFGEFEATVFASRGCAELSEAARGALVAAKGGEPRMRSYVPNRKKFCYWRRVKISGMAHPKTGLTWRRWRIPARGNNQIPAGGKADWKNMKYGTDMYHLHHTIFQRQVEWTKPAEVRRERKWELWYKYSQNFFGQQKYVFSLAKQAVMKQLKLKTNNRRLLKRSMRKLWILRLNNNCRLHGLQYRWTIRDLKAARINLDRKILSQLGIYDRGVLTNVLNVCTPDWPEQLAAREAKRAVKAFDPTDEKEIKRIDDNVIPFIEKQFPGLYTDQHVRFNRQVTPIGINYTVDSGDPKQWQKHLPRMPELANFDLPDHWLRNANANFETPELELLDKIHAEKERLYGKYYKADREAAEQAAQMEGRKKDGSRDDWFADEPQSWMD